MELHYLEKRKQQPMIQEENQKSMVLQKLRREKEFGRGGSHVKCCQRSNTTGFGTMESKGDLTKTILRSSGR